MPKPRPSHCRHGHALNPRNSYLTRPKPTLDSEPHTYSYWRCRVCDAERTKQARDKKRNSASFVGTDQAPGKEYDPRE
jgi:hypothetical protein